MHPSLEQHAPPWRTWHLITGALFLTAGVFLFLAFDYSPDLSESLAIVGFLGILILPAAFLLLLAALYAVARILGRTRNLLVPSLLLAILLAAYGWFANRPIERFRNLVLDPPPQSLSELHVNSHTSFNDGRAWLFTFHLDPTDFPALITQLGLNPASTVTSEAKSPPQQLRDDFPDIFTAPSNAQWFTAPRMILITDPNHAMITIYLDRWRHPATQT